MDTYIRALTGGAAFFGFIVAAVFLSWITITIGWWILRALFARTLPSAPTFPGPRFLYIVIVLLLMTVPESAREAMQMLNVLALVVMLVTVLRHAARFHLERMLGFMVVAAFFTDVAPTPVITGTTLAIAAMMVVVIAILKNPAWLAEPSSYRRMRA